MNLSDQLKSDRPKESASEIAFPQQAQFVDQRVEPRAHDPGAYYLEFSFHTGIIAATRNRGLLSDYPRKAEFRGSLARDTWQRHAPSAAWYRGGAVCNARPWLRR